MITYNYIVSQLKDILISSRFPYNQFSTEYRLIFADDEARAELIPESLVFCSAMAFADYLSISLPPKICFFVSCEQASLPGHIPSNCSYAAVSAPYSVMCTRIVQLFQTYCSYSRILSRVLPDRQHMEHYLNALSASLAMTLALYNDKGRILLSSDAGISAPPQLPKSVMEQTSALIQNSTDSVSSYLRRQSVDGLSMYLYCLCQGNFCCDISWFSKNALSNILEQAVCSGISLYTSAEREAARFISDIMDCALSSRSDAYERFCALTTARRKYTTVFYFIFPDSISSIERMFFSSEITRMFPQGVLGPWEKDMILFLPNESRNPRLELENQDLRDLMTHCDVHAGSSLWTTWRFRTSILLAASNAKFGRLLNLDGKSRVFYSNEYSFYHLIDLAADSFMALHHSRDLTYLLHPSVLHVNRYDLEHNTNLLEILYHYLLNGCRVNDTAAILNMHRNTIQGKLNKLNEIIQEDFTRSGLMQCRILISCMIFFYQDRYLKEPFIHPQSMAYSFKRLEER